MRSGKRLLRAALTMGMLAAAGVASTATAAGAAPPARECGTSHHSDTGNGANTTDGPYNSNCQGRPSMNGNGNGNASGRPCAGCVGNADDKNPPGQMPNGANDGNAGYECDTNKGIGQTNPAHTGCDAYGGGY